MQKIVQMENEMQLQIAHFQDTKNLFEDKISLLEDEKVEVMDREVMAICKIQDLQKQLKF